MVALQVLLIARRAPAAPSARVAALHLGHHSADRFLCDELPLAVVIVLEAVWPPHHCHKLVIRGPTEGRTTGGRQVLHYTVVLLDKKLSVDGLWTVRHKSSNFICNSRHTGPQPLEQTGRHATVHGLPEAAAPGAAGCVAGAARWSLVRRPVRHMLGEIFRATGYAT